MIETTQGQRIPGLTILQKIEDPLRLCTIYSRDNGDLVVGFGGTKANLWDILANLNPEIEAHSLLQYVEHWEYVYQPSKVTLVGHSQGGAHALKVAKWRERSRAEISVITYGGLPTKDKLDCHVTNYLNRRDPMAWVPWGVFGLGYVGEVVMLGPKGWPSFDAHDPKAYLEELAVKK